MEDFTLHCLEQLRNDTLEMMKTDEKRGNKRGINNNVIQKPLRNLPSNADCDSHFFIANLSSPAVGCGKNVEWRH